MNIKNYKYLLVLVLALFIGCKDIYADAKYEKTCYYMSSEKDFKATLTIKSGFDNGIFHGVRGYTEVYVDQNGEKIQHNREKINNWYGGLGTIFEVKKNKGGVIEFKNYYENYKEANNDSNPSCPKYLVFQDCSVYRIFATESLSDAVQATQTINQQNNCKAYYAIPGYSEEEYYGSFVNIDIDGDDLIGELTCDGLFGDKNDKDSLAHLINSILKYVRIIVPILIILLGALDLSRAVISSKEDEMKKAQTTFIKRVIIGVAVFFVPVLVDVVMYLSDIVWNGLGYSSCRI